jgi:excisionase family DNA binding protein
MELHRMAEYGESLTSRELARYLGVSEASVRGWRSDGKGPRFYKAGPRLVRYRRCDVDRWIEARLNGEQADAEKSQ